MLKLLLKSRLRNAKPAFLRSDKNSYKKLRPEERFRAEFI